MHRIRPRRAQSHHCMACLVDGDGTAFGLVQQEGAPLGPHHQTVAGGHKVLRLNGGGPAAGGGDRGLVGHVRHLRRRESRAGSGDGAQVHGRCEYEIAGVHAQYGLASAQVRLGHEHLAIQSPRTHQCRVEHVRAVGGRHNNDAVVGPQYSVEFGQHLVQHAVVLVLCTERTLSALLADGVQFVDEQDAGRTLATLTEGRPNPSRTHARKHFHHPRRIEVVEVHPAFARDGPRQ